VFLESLVRAANSAKRGNWACLHGYIPWFAILRDVQPRDAALQVDIRLLECEQLAPTHGCLYGEYDEWTKPRGERVAAFEGPTLGTLPLG